MTWQTLYEYWFRTLKEKDWFRSPDRDALDRDIRARFGGLLRQAEAGVLIDWTSTPRGKVCLIVLLDQISRHVHRGSSRAFRNDARALELARSLSRGELRGLSTRREQLFALMPFQHSEDMRDQEEGLRRLRWLLRTAFPKSRLLKSALRHQRGHRGVIRAFGRFPKRVRPSGRTREEELYVRRTPHLPY